MTSQPARTASTAPGWPRRASIAGLTLWLSFATGCQPAPRPSAEKPPPGSAAEAAPGRAADEAAVHVAAIDALFAGDTMPPLAVLQAPDTATRVARIMGQVTVPRLVLVDGMGAAPVRWLATIASGRARDTVPPADSAATARGELERRQIPRDLAEDFVAANRRPDSLHVPIAARPPRYFATLPPLSGMEEMALFDEFATKPPLGLGRPPYPGLSRILRVSRAGFAADRRHALVYVETYCGTLCAEGVLVRLSRDGERWRVTELLRLWVS